MTEQPWKKQPLDLAEGRTHFADSEDHSPFHHDPATDTDRGQIGHTPTGALKPVRPGR